MAKRKVIQPKTADSPLPRTLTQQFIRDLNSVLDEDVSIPAEYLKRYWLTKFCEPIAGQAAERRKKAIDKWLSTERRNELTNSRLQSSAGQFWFNHQYTFDDLMATARRFVLDVLGPSPSLDLLHGGFSGGASTSKRRERGHPALKFLDKADATRPAYYIWCALVRGTRWADHWNEAGLEPGIVQGNVMFTVPKNAEIDRVACKEPDLNMFLQKCLGNQIRFLLRRKGVNLNDQEINGELAREASIHGHLATLDLSSASDSMTYELVRRLLPLDWFYYLDAFRSPITEIEGVRHTNNMFSSMGNGATFELESLCFYALCRAVAYREGVRGKISIYGDDIIVPVEMVESVERILAFAGFSVNVSKSFADGPFRESCGAYWHLGIDVKPFYLRGPLTRTSDLILLLNSLIRWAGRLGVVDPRYEELWRQYAAYIPSHLYGGQDLSSRYSLVTGDRPRKELKPVTEVVSHKHVGGLLFWLFAAYGRLGFVWDPLVVLGTSETGLCRLRKNLQTVNTQLPAFCGQVA